MHRVNVAHSRPLRSAARWLWTRSNRWRCRLCGISMVMLLTWAGIAVAGDATITNVTFAGTNADLTMVISGSGFGIAPSDVPCMSCTTRYLNITGHIGCKESYDIKTWTNTRITLNGLESSPGSNILITVTNPQNKTVGVFAKAVPKSIELISPKIDSVAFAESGKNLRMTITGHGFGGAPASGLGELNLPFFVFIDLPFDSTQWEAGYANCVVGDAVTLNYESWSDTQIAVAGFGASYGKGSRKSRKWTVMPGDVVAIGVANSATSGLNFDYDVNSPVGTGTVWGGQLP